MPSSAASAIKGAKAHGADTPFVALGKGSTKATKMTVFRELAHNAVAATAALLRSHARFRVSLVRLPKHDVSGGGCAVLG